MRKNLWNNNIYKVIYLGNEVFVEESENDFADFLQFFLDLLTVLFGVHLKNNFSQFR